MWICGRKGPSGFSACSTAEQVTQGIDATGLTAIVTGASSGIGKETARVLALHGVHVVMAVRNIDSGSKVKEAILEEKPEAKIDVMELDLGSMESVRKFASEYKSSGLPLNLLIYNTMYAYGQSKLANVLHANELARRLKEEGVEITANSLHPGAIATNLLRHYSFINGLWNLVGKYLLKNVPQGAATTCYVALHPQVKGVSGEYFSDSNIAKSSPLSKDVELAKKLWDFSMTLTDPK
ncbi:NAD(P)-binding Rossmann-fold superfamily protein [Actinidia rufa]|uniref:NAD(P)-binding Rossmann-fold superfamily protein n=1 Tax=Actinidia rufa TaxID=165716 RepID=A0A7J0FRP2_9ERIC|nr:NAD(P)-binding Rossmann-fold superfamily protein [Actinidia rufa]